MGNGRGTSSLHRIGGSLWFGFHAQTKLVKQEGPHIRTLFDLFV
jgi:hypothetical protein